MVVLDLSIVNVALATIKTDLGFSQTGLQWVITRVRDPLRRLPAPRRPPGRHARPPAASSSPASRSSPSPRSSAVSPGRRARSIVFRAHPGPRRRALRAGRALDPDDDIPEGRERNLALGIWGAASGGGAAVGVLLGGVLTSYLTWPWIFYLNVPVGLALVLLAPRRLAESRADNAGRHFDVAGASTITASLMVLVYALTRATQSGWTSVSTVALLAVGRTARRRVPRDRAEGRVAARAVRGVPRQHARRRRT